MVSFSLPKNVMAEMSAAVFDWMVSKVHLPGPTRCAITRNHLTAMCKKSVAPLGLGANKAPLGQTLDGNQKGSRGEKLGDLFGFVLYLL